MAYPDYYRTLGVAPGASAKEIKSAHRDLVKKYHPDLFATATDKAEATHRLQEINDAYAVLGNPKRRREYDAQRLQTGAASTQRPDGGRTKKAPAKPATARSRRHPGSPQSRIAGWRRYAASPKLAAYLLGLVVCGWLVFHVNSEPRVATAWILLEKTVVEPRPAVPETGSAADEWSVAARYPSRSDCRDGLKEKVKKDEQEGSQAIVDELGGTVGITVHLRDEAKRVRNYECRETKVVSDSFVRRALRQIGLVS